MSSESARVLSDELDVKYCPLDGGELVSFQYECAACRYRPEPPFRLCAPPRHARPRRRGFWDNDDTSERLGL